MHVLLLPATYPRSYKPLSGIFYRDQARALHRNGVRVGVIDPAPRALRSITKGGVGRHRFQVEEVDDEGIPVVRANDWCLPKVPRLFARQFLSRAPQLLDHYTRRFGRPDIVHAHEILWGGVAARAAWQQTGVPYVVTEHSGEYGMAGIAPWKSPYVRSVMRDASAMIGVSAALLATLDTIGPMVAPAVVPNVVDTGFFRPTEDRPADGPYRFVSIAFQLRDKGVDTLLRAFAAAFPHPSGVLLDLGGAGRDQPAFETLARELGIRERVRWLGALTREQVRDALQRADGFALCSRYETFGVTLVEAMAAGLPVVATRCGGPQDFVHDGVGRLVAVDDDKGAAAAMQALVHDRAAWRAQAPAIRRFAVERFGEAAVVERLRTVYEVAMGRGHTRERARA
ncbi:MAG: glycosyltransferase family 4 protein [Acidimicrobiia bacterium]|nr:glycosyltransferase family 4 protein [Acidimicrobiia bacterium]